MELTREELKEKVKLLPFAPGIYIMKDKNGTVIYVGKSKSLHNRVSHYFQPLSSLDVKTAKMSSQIFDFECIYTASEAEALILENELIKRHTPKYNIKLKDAKTYPYIRISYEDLYPQISISRTRKDDKASYFGPYTSARSAKEIIETVCKTFRVDTCGKKFAPKARLPSLPVLPHWTMHGRLQRERYERGVQGHLFRDRAFFERRLARCDRRTDGKDGKKRRKHGV